MISRVKNWIKSCKGPFTKEGAYIDYTEVHVFENGFLYGFRNVKSQDGWERVKEAEDGASEEYTYYHWGYVIGNRIKIGGAGACIGIGAKLAGLF